VTEVVLRAESLSKWYGQVIGLNDVTVEIPSGITGLLGPNGAGKSTFLKLATGLIRPSRGRLGVLGQDPWNNPRLLRRIGLAPEHDTFYDRMTGLQFVMFLARLHGMRPTQAERAARNVLEQVGLKDAMNRRVGAYSKGMKQRAKIAQALVHDPEVLFLDEPLTGTDPVGRREMIQFVRQLGKSGKSILVSSHVLYEIEAMTRNILLIARGRILAEGQIQQIRALIDEHPHNVRIEVDRPRELAQEVAALPGVVTLRLPADGVLEVETRRPEDFYARVTPLLLKGRYRVVSMTSPDDNLQAVFKYLVG
jgi:ABC-2 type transport system ATP-binding protein